MAQSVVVALGQTPNGDNVLCKIQGDQHLVQFVKVVKPADKESPPALFYLLILQGKDNIDEVVDLLRTNGYGTEAPTEPKQLDYWSAIKYGLKFLFRWKT